MRLENPGVGEISDRLSILALKVLFGHEQGKDIAHFKAEQGALLSKIRTRTLNGKWFEAYTELAAVNAVLWHAEDTLRALRNQVPSTIVDVACSVAFRIQALNDTRAVLIERINKDAGEHLGGEKLNE